MAGVLIEESRGPLRNRRPRSTIAVMDPTPAIAASNASNRFGFDLYDRLRRQDGNLIVSPISAAVTLAMASAGATGNTLQEMERGLHLRGLARPHVAFGGLLGALRNRDGRDGMALHLANRIWAQLDIPLESDFVAILNDRFAAPLGRVDFRRAIEAARFTINAWASKETRDRIRNIASEDTLTRDVLLVLASAVYFKGEWEFPFDPAETTMRSFAMHASKVETRMMRQGDAFAHARLHDVQVIELPYRGGLSMVIVLPDAVDGLSAVEDRIREDYDRWLAALRMKPVDLELPPWKTESLLRLEEPLVAMGLQLAFTDAADFSGIAKSTPLKIGSVLQKVFVETNEAGTEAAAVTIHTSNIAGRFTPPAKFHANRPFLYFIRDPATGVVVFIGRIVDPR
jgi:serpin B